MSADAARRIFLPLYLAYLDGKRTKEGKLLDGHIVPCLQEV